MKEPTLRGYTMVWAGLIAIVAVEAALTYAHLSTGTLLACLLALAFLEAAIGLLYFMHLRYERSILFWSIVPIMVFVFLFMDHIWPDALRLLHMRPPAP
ncbi:MAG TPA: cytochrome C oxidase subunit IV family protein [Gemmatimonadales bacterium]|nr:cytochrome C oxidase subunit IV family protein [Gemmatimonadales bacterium]